MTEIKTTKIPQRQECVNKEHPYIGGTKDVIDDELGKPQSEVNQETNESLSTHAQQIEDLQAMEQIVIDGGEAQIAQGSDFDNPDSAKRAKIPTVGAVLDGISEGVFNLTTKTGESYASLQDALSAANTAIPANKKKGGMQLSFVQSSDNNYVQYRLMSDTFNTTVTNWQGVDDEPVAGSDNLVKSGGVYKVQELAEQTLADISEITELTPFSESAGHSIAGEIGDIATENVVPSATIRKYNIVAGKQYVFNARYSASFVSYLLYWLDSNNRIISKQYQGTSGQVDVWSDVAVIAPEGATQVWENCRTANIDVYNFSLVGNTIKSRNLASITSVDEVKENVSAIDTDVLQITSDISETTLLSPATSVDNSYVTSEGEIGSNNSFRIDKYTVEAGKIYTFSGKYGSSSSSNLYFVHWFDANNNWLGFSDYHANGESEVVYTDMAVRAPENAAYAYLSVFKGNISYFNFTSVGDAIKSDEIKKEVIQNTSDISQNTSDISQNISNINDITADISELTQLEPDNINSGHYFKSDGTIAEASNFSLYRYEVTEGNLYTFTGIHGANVSILFLAWADENNEFLVAESYGGRDVTYIDKPVKAPAGAHYAWLNVRNGLYPSDYNFKVVGETIKLRDLINDSNSKKLMKVVVNGLEMAVESTPFYIRTRYNEDKDIIITHRVNKNTLITFRNTYVGDNTLSDSELMTSTYLVSSHDDSTAPPYDIKGYWELFAQHGYPIPTINNSVGMTDSDVDALWKDQLDREYHIGKVTAETIYLLPVIYQDAQGHDTRDWKSLSDSDAITSLIHVSGGSYTTTFSVQGYGYVQLHPIMKHEDRKWYADGVQLIKEGTYYCDEFQVNETQIGYDPASISDWFGGADGSVDLTGAEIMLKETYSFNYKGAQCCVNTTFSLFKELSFFSYGATQQLFFYDKDSYDAMFMIPKAAARGGVELDKPFHSGSSSATYYDFYRKASHLKDINDPIDRQIGFLYDSNAGKYLVGMAAGLSLVSGETVTAKRIQNCLVGDTRGYYRLGSISPANKNKFYIAAINASPFEQDDYWFPNTYFKEINFYVSYFDPAENTGQVYWYKDGSKYVIYCHCQSVQNRLGINVPEFMEGLHLSVVEKTANTELLTETIQNGKFFVNYNTNDANYIVLKAE